MWRLFYSVFTVPEHHSIFICSSSTFTLGVGTTLWGEREEEFDGVATGWH